MLPRRSFFVCALLLAACPGSADDGPDFADGTEGPNSVSGSTSSSATGPGTTTTPASTTGTPGSSSDDGSGDGPALDVDPPDSTTGGEGECEAEEPVIAGTPCEDVGILLESPFDQHYGCRDFGQVPGVPSEAGGVTFSLDDPDVLLIGGRANHPQGRLYAIRVTRGAECHVNGFAEDTATEVATARYNDGGLAYGPDGVLFAAQWPENVLAQYFMGSAAPDIATNLGGFGVGPSSIAGLAFVPPEFAGEGALKIVTWEDGDWFTLDIEAEPTGGFNILSADAGPTLGGGPEGIVYVSADSPGIDVDSILVAEYSNGSVALYEAGDQGDPVVDTRVDFITGLEGALGAHIDYTAGDFLFSTFGGGDRLIAVRGFPPNLEPEG